MADIFVSYKREDRDRVQPLVNGLMSRGWSVWWDTRIGAGEKWDRVIERELEAAKCILVVWSQLSIESDWVRLEAYEGRDRQCLVPVTIQGVKPPLAFRLIQFTDLTNWRGERNDDRFEKICLGVERHATREQKRLGTCCEVLKDVIESNEFEPLMRPDDNGILYMSIGMLDPGKDDEPNMVDHPVFFCPFCGTQLHTLDEVDAKTAN